MLNFPSRDWRIWFYCGSSQKHSICSLCLISIYWILYETTNTKLCQKMPLTRSGSKKPSDNFGRTIADNLALSKFLANLNSYVSYITPHLKSDGSNMSQWIDSVNDLAHLLFDIKTFSEMRITLIGSMNPWITRFCISWILWLRLIFDKFWRMRTLPWMCFRCWRSIFTIQWGLVNLSSSTLWLRWIPPFCQGTSSNFSQSCFNCLVYVLILLLTVQGLFLQALTAPPMGTSKTQLKNLILAAD